MLLEALSRPGIVEVTVDSHRVPSPGTTDPRRLVAEVLARVVPTGSRVVVRYLADTPRRFLVKARTPDPDPTAEPAPGPDAPPGGPGSPGAAAAGPGPGPTGSL